jgi:hypothetical protein
MEVGGWKGEWGRERSEYGDFELEVWFRRR